MGTNTLLQGQFLDGGLSAQTNYIKNPNAHKNTTGWAAYKDAAASSPVDGTGGSPALTITRSTSSPLRGVASFLLTTTAANLQGEGVSYDFSIDSADKAKVLQFSFDWATDVTTTTGDFAVYIYDVTNASMIQPAGYQILGGVSGQVYKHTGTFQTNSNSTSYRLIIHRAVTTATATNLKIDDVRCGPQVTAAGAVISDLIAYTPIVSNLGTGSGTATGFYSRRGDTFVGRIKFVKDGSTGSGSSAVAFSIPSGLTIDSSKLLPGLQAALGTAWAFGIKGSVTETNSTVSYTSNSIVVMNMGDASGNPLFGSNINAGAIITMEFEVPIVGWSSNTAMSSDTDTRVVAARVTSTDTTSIASSGSGIIVWNGTTYDTHGAISSNKFTAPVSGYYKMTATVQFNASTNTINQYVDMRFRKNGSTYFGYFPFFFQTATSVRNTMTTTDTVQLNAGDYVEVYINNQTGSAKVPDGASTDNYWEIERISGPATIAASETVAASYSLNGTQSITAGSFVTMTLDTKVFDTHNAMSSSIFTCPVSGKYEISLCSIWDAGATAPTEVQVNVVQNSTNYQIYDSSDFANSKRYNSTGSVVLNCNAGDTLKFQIKSTAQNITLTSNSANGTIGSIRKIGN